MKQLKIILTLALIITSSTLWAATRTISPYDIKKIDQLRNWRGSWGGSSVFTHFSVAIVLNDDQKIDLNLYIDSPAGYGEWMAKRDLKRIVSEMNKTITDAKKAGVKIKIDTTTDSEYSAFTKSTVEDFKEVTSGQVADLIELASQISSGESNSNKLKVKRSLLHQLGELSHQMNK